MKKRLLAVLLAVCLVIPGCGGKTSPAESPQEASSSEAGGKTVVLDGKEINLEEDTKKPFETIYVEQGDDYDNLISAINRTMNQDNLTMSYDYQGISSVTFKKTKNFLEIKMKAESMEFVMAGEVKEDAKESVKFYVSITAPDETGTIQSMKQMAVMVPDQGEGTGDLLSDFNVNTDDLFDGKGKEDFEITKQQNGDVTTYALKYVGENADKLNNADGNYMTCDVRDGYVEKILVLSPEEAESDKEIMPITFSRDKVVFDDYNDADYQEVSQEEIVWSLFAGIMSLAMGSGDLQFTDDEGK